jgi:NDP-sugar pyrophosphorylase family protein
MYVLEPTVMKYIEPNQKLDMPDLITRLLANKEKVQGFTIDDYYLDIGMREHYEKAVRDFPQMKSKLLKQF